MENNHKNTKTEKEKIKISEDKKNVVIAQPTHQKFFTPKKMIGWFLWACVAIFIFYWIFKNVLKFDWNFVLNTNIAIWAIILLFSALLIRSCIYALMQKLIFSFFKIKVAFYKSLLIFFIAGFFGIITPFSSGSEAMKIFLLKKEKVPMDKLIPALVIQNFINQVCSVVATLICFSMLFIVPSLRNVLTYISNLDINLLGLNPLTIFIVLLSLGVLVNIIWSTFVIFIGTSRRLLLTIIRLFTKIGLWVKLIKTKHHRIKIIDMWKVKVIESKKNFLLLWGQKKLLILLFSLSFSWLFFQALTTYIILKGNPNAANLSHIPFYEVQIMSILVDAANNYLPIPSSAGSFEITYNALMEALFYQNNASLTPEEAHNLAGYILVWVRISLTMMNLFYAIIGFSMMLIIHSYQKEFYRTPYIEEISKKETKLPK